MKRHTMREPIFGSEVVLLVGTTEEYKRFIRRRFPRIKDLAAKNDRALYECKRCPDGTKDRFIWLPDWKDDTEHLTTLTHEVVHATAEVMRYVGMRLVNASEEAYTHYHEWLLRECLTYLKKGGVTCSRR